MAHELDEDASLLHADVVSPARLVDAAGDLVAIARAGGEDSAPALLSAHLLAVAERIDATARAPAGGVTGEPGGLEAASAELDAALDDARSRRALVATPTDEVVRLIGAVAALKASAGALGELTAGR